MINVYQEYKKKLKTPDEAVKIVKDGDWVDYSTVVCAPQLLDEALARRKDELHGVNIRGNLGFGPVQVAEQDPSREHFYYNTWHCSGYERHLIDRGLCNFIPMLFRNLTSYYKRFLTVNVAMMCVPPMDDKGFFNLSCGTGVARDILRVADYVILEVNEHMPVVYGAYDDHIHISDVDCVVEGKHEPLHEVPAPPATEDDIKIADYILPYIKNGDTLQLGIGGMPNVLGKRIAESDLKDLGMHTELCSDGYYDLYEAGKLTNERKKIYPGKGVTGIIFGSKKLYEWADHNQGILSAPLSFVNSPATVRQIDDMVSINNCISVDLYGQIAAETAGGRHISGTGGQLDFLTGAYAAENGRGFICLTSTFTDKQGQVHSRIQPNFCGEIVTDPRAQAYYIVTEQGIVNLAGRTTWERAERIISIAHPDFRENLIKEAEKMKIWRKTNKK